MGSSKRGPPAKAALPYKTGNKLKRQGLFIQQKRARDAKKREDHFRRKKDEEKDPSLREERLKRNQPLTLDKKRVWDEVDDEDEATWLGASVDVERAKRPRVDIVEESENEGPGEDDHDSMLDSGSEDERDSEQATKTPASKDANGQDDAGAPTESMLEATLEALKATFPAFFHEEPRVPKVLITTSLNSTLHKQAEHLTGMFPNSVYVPRSAHRYGHKFSVREIASFASNRNYTSLLVLREDQKKPTGLTVVHLPQGPTFHFTISNYFSGKQLPGHGNATEHFPELILNNFRTPLGLLTAQLFRSLLPPRPELTGRQVVTLHNQRDYIFVRRHRYVFREKRETEKSIVGTDGKPVKGVEEIRAGLQELGPRFTLKLRRVDKGIGRGSEVKWEWKPRMEKQRTKFQL